MRLDAASQIALILFQIGMITRSLMKVMAASTGFRIAIHASTMTVRIAAMTSRSGSVHSMNAFLSTPATTDTAVDMASFTRVQAAGTAVEIQLTTARIAFLT